MISKEIFSQIYVDYRLSGKKARLEMLIYQYCEVSVGKVKRLYVVIVNHVVDLQFFLLHS